MGGVGGGEGEAGRGVVEHHVPERGGRWGQTGGEVVVARCRVVGGGSGCCRPRCAAGREELGIPPRHLNCQPSLNSQPTLRRSKFKRPQPRAKAGPFVFAGVGKESRNSPPTPDSIFHTHTARPRGLGSAVRGGWGRGGGGWMVVGEVETGEGGNWVRPAPAVAVRVGPPPPRAKATDTARSGGPTSGCMHSLLLPCAARRAPPPRGVPPPYHPRPPPRRPPQ